MLKMDGCQRERHNYFFIFTRYTITIVLVFSGVYFIIFSPWLIKVICQKCVYLSCFQSLANTVRHTEFPNRRNTKHPKNKL